MKTVGANTLLGNLPNSLVEELLTAFGRIATNYRERKWEPSELNGGKFCEVVYCILRGHVDGQFPTSATRPHNMIDACRSLEKAGTRFPRSVTIHIPRMLVVLYEVRNNRGVAHVGGDVDPNHMDASCVLHMSKWVLAELVRLYNTVTPQEAADAVDSIIDRVLPLIWEVDGKRRVLDTSFNMREKTLLLLYNASGPVHERDLREWTEHSNLAVYRRDVLRRLHSQRLIEYDASERLSVISPTGIDLVERELLPKNE